MSAGRLDRRQLGALQRAALLVFRGLDGDFRDWTQIRDWTNGVARQLAPPVLISNKRCVRSFRART